MRASVNCGASAPTGCGWRSRVHAFPCRTFAQWLSVQGWIKTFTGAALPGAYLRVVQPGTVRAGDDIEVVGRPDHSVTIGVVFRALTTEPELLPLLLDAEALPDALKERARRRV